MGGMTTKGAIHHDDILLFSAILPAS